MGWIPEPDAEQSVAFARTDALTVTAGASPWPAPYDLTIQGVRAAVGTAPSGADVVVDVNKNGTSIYPTATKPTIGDGNTSSSEAAPDTTAVAEGDLLTVDIDQVGSSTAGSDLVVVVRYQEA